MSDDIRDIARAGIEKSHPLTTGRHDIYDRALILVGERHDKGDLVDLVNWLLHERIRLRGALALIEMHEGESKSGSQYALHISRDALEKSGAA